MAERTVEKIVIDVTKARRQSLPIKWSINDLIEDISIICAEIITERPKVEKGNKSASKRVRIYTKTLETLGKTFRKTSV